MRTLLKVTIPTEPGNRAILDGTLPKTMQAFVDEFKPEASYFFAENGQRTALFVVELKDATQIPVVAEPFFMNLGASLWSTPVMNANDLKVGLEKAAVKFAKPRKELVGAR